jgi:hypothetical protein
MTYAEQLLIIKAIPIREGDSKIIQCPFCYGEKKFAISRLDGKLMWNCYRASCDGRGIYSGTRNLEATKNYVNKCVVARQRKYRPIPSMTTAIENHPAALAYVKSVNSYEAYQKGYVRLRYAPADGRVLFYSNNLEGAVGRSIEGNRPKWMSYGELPDGIHVGEGLTAVLVEDTPSACAVSRCDGLVGIALLGTKVTDGVRSTLNKYNLIYLILDKDAALLSLRECRGSRNIKVRFTKSDLKSLSPTEIYNLIDLN